VVLAHGAICALVQFPRAVTAAYSVNVNLPDQLWRKSVSSRFGMGELATTATSGFMYVPTCAGTPTGVPAGTPSGFMPLVWDSTNHALYVYDGSWRKVGP
jgi:hypothetical protein